jgi:hypothetical protein
MHEYFPNKAKQNSVVSNDLWSLDCAEHCCIHVPIAFERLFNANSGTRNFQINADVTGIVTDRKKPSSTAGFF